MKTKILSLAVIAGVFTGCSQFNLPTLNLPTLPQPQPQAMGINHELIKDIKTDGKGGYYVTKDEDCDKLMQAGVIKKIKSMGGGFHSNFYHDECTGVVLRNIGNDAARLELEAFRMPKNF